MAFIFILAAILLLGAAFRLWHVRKTRNVDLEVETDIMSVQESQLPGYPYPAYPASQPIYPGSPQYSPLFPSQPDYPGKPYAYPPDYMPGYAQPQYSAPPGYGPSSRGKGFIRHRLPLAIALLLIGGLLGFVVVLLHSSPAVHTLPWSFLWIAGATLLGIIIIAVIIIAASHFYHFLKARQQQRRLLLRGAVGLRTSYRRTRYTGRLVFPRQVYEGNSESISLTFQKGRFQDLPVQEQIALHIPTEGTSDGYLLEVELLAAGLTVDGNRLQRQPLGARLLSYRWNCYFPNSGKHIFTLILRVVGPSGTLELETIERLIKVTKFAGLTQQQVGIAAAAAGTAGFILTLVSIFSMLHIFGL